MNETIQTHSAWPLMRVILRRDLFKLALIAAIFVSLCGLLVIFHDLPWIAGWIGLFASLAGLTYVIATMVIGDFGHVLGDTYTRNTVGWLRQQPISSDRIVFSVIAIRAIWLVAGWAITRMTVMVFDTTSGVPLLLPIVAALLGCSLAMTATQLQPVGDVTTRGVITIATFVVAASVMLFSFDPSEGTNWYVYVVSWFLPWLALIVGGIWYRTAFASARHHASPTRPHRWVTWAANAMRNWRLTATKTTSSRGPARGLHNFQMQQCRVSRRAALWFILVPTFLIFASLKHAGGSEYVFAFVITFIAATIGRSGMTSSVRRHGQSRIPDIVARSPTSSATFAWMTLATWVRQVSPAIFVTPMIVWGWWLREQTHADLIDVVERMGGWDRALAMHVALLTIGIAVSLLTMSMEMAGRPWITVIMMLALGGSSIFAIAWSAMTFAQYGDWLAAVEATRQACQWITPIALGLLSIKLIASAWAAVAGLRRGLYQPRTAIVIGCGWMAIVAAIGWATLPLRVDGFITPLHVLVLTAVVVPLASILAAPTAVDIDRHR